MIARSRGTGSVSLLLLASLVLLSAVACGPGEPPSAEYRAQRVPPRDERAPCLDRNPLRNAYFGDLHVHTALSVDAYQYDVRVRPDGAYRYAFGEEVALPPLGPDGEGTRRVRIDRPLDFAAVTDHAEFLGELRLCIDPESGVYDDDFCEVLRTGSVRSPELAMHIMTPIPWRETSVCGDDYARCAEAEAPAWQEIIDAAEAWNDTSRRCERTTFVAYEWSSVRLGANLHRNVVFRDRSVLQRPISYNETSREWDLWRQLEELCVDAGTGCDVIAIPHNSNISNGRMFAVDYPGLWSEEMQRERAALRARLEPVVEVMQHKGDSECQPTMPGVLGAPDELCGFEKFEDSVFRLGGGRLEDRGECYAGPFEDAVPRLRPGSCLDPLSYTRYALIEGLAEEERLGVNPFQFGLMASTDTHNGTPGAVEERSFGGHLGRADAGVEVRTSEGDVLGNASNGPGGLIGAWAEENTRDAIFDAIRRREVFGTSGPRIQPRFYAGFGLPDDLCDAPDWLARAERSAVPMGGVVAGMEARLEGPEGQGAASPGFLVSALRDPGTASAPGGMLQRIQIVKGWVDDEGRRHAQVFDAAGGENGASVDPATCQPRGPGHDRLCAVWRDPDFDPERRAVYYARVLENPSCRFTQWQCNALPAAERPEGCAGNVLPRTQQERAWTSPIWYAPAPGSGGGSR